MCPDFNYNSGSTQYIQTERDERKKNNTTQLGSTLMETMLKEVSDFCDPIIQENWSLKPHHQVHEEQSACSRSHSAEGNGMKGCLIGGMPCAHALTITFTSWSIPDHQTNERAIPFILVLAGCPSCRRSITALRPWGGTTTLLPLSKQPSSTDSSLRIM